MNKLDKSLMLSMCCIYAALPGALIAWAAQANGWPEEAFWAGFILAFGAPFVSLQCGFELFEEYLDER